MRDTEAVNTNKQQDGPKSKDDPAGQSLRITPIPESAIWWGAAVLLIIAVVSVWLLIAFFGGGSPQDKIRLEAIKLAGSIVVGTGGAVALVLATRRQRATELQLLQQERTAADTRHDGEERRISDLQASAGEQLGNEKAAVRLNGLYQLERLGQNHPAHRQTVVDVICAYLRMPFTHPDQIASEFDNTDTDIKSAREEVQVRLTAQRILTKHLHPDLDEHTGQPTNEKFWDNIILDLAGAVLTDLNFFRCHIARGFFQDAHFYGSAGFAEAHFDYLAEFSGAHFHDKAHFRETQFHGLAGFSDVHFHNKAWFFHARFHDSTWFQEARFHNQADFHRTHFFKLPTIIDARCRWDVHRRYDVWPEGWTARAPKSDEDGRIEGEDGAWGYVVPTTMEVIEEIDDG